MLSYKDKLLGFKKEPLSKLDEEDQMEIEDQFYKEETEVNLTSQEDQIEEHLTYPIIQISKEEQFDLYKP